MPDNVQQLRRPYQQQLQVQGTDYAQIGMTACIAAVCTSVIAGGIALARGKKPFHDQMVKFRMIVVATGTGFYAASSGLLPPPAGLSVIMGREPGPIPGAPQLSPPAGRSSTPPS